MKGLNMVTFLALLMLSINIIDPSISLRMITMNRCTELELWMTQPITLVTDKNLRVTQRLGAHADDDW